MTGGDGRFHDAAKAFGVPAAEGASPRVQQSYADMCAVQCQRFVLEQFGVSVSEDQLLHEAQARGIYSPGAGTRLEDVGKLLESHGVPVHRNLNANIVNLATELAQGHPVIVGLDSGQMWDRNSILESIAAHFGIGRADHAVIVAGIDTSDPAHVSVIITDPGTGDVAKRYPLSDFLGAWKASQFAMVASRDPAPAWNPAMVNFDYTTGRIPTIGDVPYRVAEQLQAAASGNADASVVHELETVFVALAGGELHIGELLHRVAEDALHKLPGVDLLSTLTSLLPDYHSEAVADGSTLHLTPADTHHSDHLGITELHHDAGDAEQFFHPLHDELPPYPGR